MKFSKSDLPFIRWSLISITVSILISAAVLFASDQYAAQVQKDVRTAKRMQNDARQRLAVAEEDQQNMGVYAEEYTRLSHSDIFNGDQRLDWMEALERIRQQHHVEDFSYTISPQRTYVPKPAIDSGNFDLRYSEMNLQFDLLHEGQLVNFFAALRNQINGWYQLGGCDVHRIGQANANALIAKNLRATCTGGWVTLNNRSAPQ